MDSSKDAKGFHNSLISGGMNSEDALRKTREHYPDFMKEVILEQEEEEEKPRGIGLLTLLFGITILVGGVSAYIFIDIPFI